MRYASLLEIWLKNDDIQSLELCDSTFTSGLSIELQYILKQEHIVPDLSLCFHDIYEGLQGGDKSSPVHCQPKEQ